MSSSPDAERARLADADAGGAPWRAWGPYLSERAWGTVREDYSADGSAWDHFPHDHARSRAYRWSEDGLAGVCDSRQTFCLGLALWNGVDPLLKERIVRPDRPGGQPRRGRQGLLVVPRLHAHPLVDVAGATTTRSGSSPTPSWLRRTPAAASTSRSTSSSTPVSFADDRFWAVHGRLRQGRARATC